MCSTSDVYKGLSNMLKYKRLRKMLKYKGQSKVLIYSTSKMLRYKDHWQNAEICSDPGTMLRSRRTKTWYWGLHQPKYDAKF